jgi:hypothetical protein
MPTKWLEALYLTGPQTTDAEHEARSFWGDLRQRMLSRSCSVYGHDFRKAGTAVAGSKHATGYGSSRSAR